MNRVLSPKDYLNQIKTFDTKILQRESELKRLRELSDSVSAGIIGTRVQTSVRTDRQEETVIRIIELEEEINSCIKCFINAKHLIINQIQDMHEDNYINVLFKRYVEYKQLEKIAYEMNYSYVHIKRIHNTALSEIGKNVICRDMIPYDTCKCDIMAS